MFETDAINEDAIVITGMSCRFPGANNINEFWRNLQNGVESLTLFTDEELLASGVVPDFLNNPNYVKAGCILDDIESFAASFFGYSVEDAELLDPQQRLLIECTHEALEDAGCVPRTYEGRIGVFTGVRESGYSKVLGPIIARRGTLKSIEALLGTAVDEACQRISYTFNLQGPSIGVQTACSASLTAVHIACESIRNRECDMALVGAASIMVPQKEGYFYEEGVVLSPDGHCRAFDVNAQGAGAGFGLGVVVLKRYSEALADRDQIYAVIRGSALNSDGSAKVGFRAPGIQGNMEVIAEAIDMADIEAETISYVEANGTGTFIGDSIELDALTRVFRAQTDKKGFCRIGSVKTNIGHLAQAAGMAGLIKTALCLKHGQLPPSLNFETPNPKLSESPFYVNTKLSEWQTNGCPRRAVINSFAVGGSNACMIVEEALASPLARDDEGGSGFRIMTLSAKSERALRNLGGRYEDFLKGHLHAPLENICFTANSGREHFSHRFAGVADSTQQLYEQMRALSSREMPAGCAKGHVESRTDAKIAFVFGDQESQYIGMGRKIYDTHPCFRQVLDRCDDLLKPHLNLSILSVIFGEGDNLSMIDEARYAWPAVFAIEYALAEMWRSWGIEPSVLMGHGVGEYVAACVAGIFTLEDGLMLISARGGLDADLFQKDSSTAAFREVAGKVSYSSPRIGMLSSETGRLLEADKVCEIGYWCRQIRKPAGLESGLEALHAQGCELFLEIGPGSALSETVRKHLPQNAGIWLPSLDKEGDDWRRVLESLGEFYIRGSEVDWSAFNPDHRSCRISLPTYPFERERCWFDPELRKIF